MSFKGHVQRVQGVPIVVKFTPVIDTSIYAAGDVLFITQEIENALPVSVEGKVKLESVVVLDADNQNSDIDLVFLNANVSIGALNGAVVLTTANLAAAVLGIQDVVAANYTELDPSTNSIARVPNNSLDPLMMDFGRAATSIFVAGIVRTQTPTYTAATSLTVHLGFSAGY